MNPFQLTGGSFLLFYVLFGIAALWAFRAVIKRMEAASGPAQNLTDPYQIACLRGGEEEAIRVATVSLLDRGLLEANGEILSTKGRASIDLAKRQIEKAILSENLTPGAARDVFGSTVVKRATAEYTAELKKQGLLADGATFSKRVPVLLVTLAALGGVTVTKIQIAFSQGRHNVGFLVMLTLLFAGIAFFIWRRRRTGAGDAMLADLKQLFARLKSRAKSLKTGGATSEAALLAAVFGLAALPAASFPFMDKLYPNRSGDGTSGSSCSSSSSCSSGSSCGGGCGGGGCGG